MYKSVKKCIKVLQSKVGQSGAKGGKKVAKYSERWYNAANSGKVLQSAGNWGKMKKSVKKCMKVLQIGAKGGKRLQSTAKGGKMKKSVKKCMKVLQSGAKVEFNRHSKCPKV